MASNDPGVRKTVASLGGRARVANADPDELTATRRAAAAAANSPAARARSIVKAWPGLSQSERNEVRRILAAVMDGRASTDRPR